ncbi:MAG: rRNA maturation RNase YbeY [Solirubrobacterales bacterium]
MTADLADVPEALRPAAAAALRAAGVEGGHLSVELVGREQIRDLNLRHRGLDEPTDVLSFPIDGAEFVAGPRELGDVAICPELTADMIEATVHGVLHLCGFDHEVDDGEMLDLQDSVVGGLHESRTSPNR